MNDKNFQILERQLDQLLARYAQCEQENAALRAKEAAWHQERTRLIEKNDVARQRVEAMIRRLRQLQGETTPSL